MLKNPKYVYKRDGRKVPFDRKKITTAIYKAAASCGGHNLELSKSLSNKVVEFLIEHFPQNTILTVENVQDVVEKVLIEEGRARTAKAYILYRHNRAETRRVKRETKRNLGNIPYDIIWRTLLWNVDYNVETVDKLNGWIKSGKFPELVSVCERSYEEQVDTIAREIVENSDKLRIVIVTGPSSSGKTTTTIKLRERLKNYGLKLVSLNVDSYFFDIELHPRDEYGDYDFETPEALDLNLVNEHLNKLLDGKTIQVPRYDFKTGHREKETDSLKLHKNEIILIDSLHGLYSQMTGNIPDESLFKLYIETLAQLKDREGEFVRWADIRMMRRMIRDKLQRSYDPIRTVGHWHYVRRSELKHIIPFIHQADYILNSALAYELPVLKHYLFKFFPEIIRTYRNEPGRQDAYFRAERVYKLLGALEEVTDDSPIPGNSLLREFIGGSIYQY
ncbi:response regulator SirA [candidate division WOR-3 bacterium JGI_Cruoil_03_44_89]|uniref:Response regulator SirA n=1 Tax=candidate division WOR-3 bacterium JGI_Cruoil_03_44_89 TaxID=1973748 RepID=A0A235BN86_UNCW3|nr:MAG: response regulator SirA [candidate division WOR-3 bacterium JGI_Cruoil_03_44_89]